MTGSAGPWKIALKSSLNVARVWLRNAIWLPMITARPCPTANETTFAWFRRSSPPKSQPLAVRSASSGYRETTSAATSKLGVSRYAWSSRKKTGHSAGIP